MGLWINVADLARWGTCTSPEPEIKTSSPANDIPASIAQNFPSPPASSQMSAPAHRQQKEERPINLAVVLFPWHIHYSAWQVRSRQSPMADLSSHCAVLPSGKEALLWPLNCSPDQDDVTTYSCWPLCLAEFFSSSSHYYFHCFMKGRVSQGFMDFMKPCLHGVSSLAHGPQEMRRKGFDSPEELGSGFGSTDSESCVVWDKTSFIVSTFGGLESCRVHVNWRGELVIYLFIY